MTLTAEAKKRKNPTLLDFAKRNSDSIVQKADAESIVKEIQNVNGGEKEKVEKAEIKDKNASSKKKLWFTIVDEAIVNEAHLLSYYYDPERNSALLCFYDEEKQRIAYWYDKTNHKPYFLVKEEPNEAERLVPRDLRERVIGMETVEKTNLLTMKKEKYTRILVNDPLAVKELRGRFGDSWESNIKYHQNFIYDTGLVPGYKYKVSGKNLIPFSIASDSDSQLKEIFKGESEEVKAFAE
nr:hypothetical protein [Desulfurococcales archaeon]